jgi:hypothetical protein
MNTYNITYRKPANAVVQASAPVYDKKGELVIKRKRSLSTDYRGFTIEKCTLGGYRIRFNGKVVQHDVSHKRTAKGIIDKLVKLVPAGYNCP